MFNKTNTTWFPFEMEHILYSGFHIFKCNEWRKESLAGVEGGLVLERDPTGRQSPRLHWDSPCDLGWVTSALRLWLFHWENKNAWEGSLDFKILFSPQAAHRFLAVRCKWSNARRITDPCMLSKCEMHRLRFNSSLPAGVQLALTLRKLLFPFSRWVFLSIGVHLGM